MRAQTKDHQKPFVLTVVCEVQLTKAYTLTKLATAQCSLQAYPITGPALLAYISDFEPVNKNKRATVQMQRSREDMEGVQAPQGTSKRYTSNSLTRTKRESGLHLSLDKCGLATAHLRVLGTQRRRERLHCPSRPAPVTQRCVTRMGRWLPLQKETTSADVASLHKTTTYGGITGKSEESPVCTIYFEYDTISLSGVKITPHKLSLQRLTLLRQRVEDPTPTTAAEATPPTGQTTPTTPDHDRGRREDDAHEDVRRLHSTPTPAPRHTPKVCRV
jgi:hypothetical protein